MSVVPWLDRFFVALRTSVGGVLLPQRPQIDIVGAGASVVDVPDEDLTRITIGGSAAWKDPVRASSTAALPASTYASGVLTANVNGAIAAQDGVTLVLGDSLLVPFQAAGLQNGIYTLTQVGSGSAPWKLTRRSDSDTTGKLLAGSRVAVTEGTAYGGREWRLDTTGTITIGTTSQSWSVNAPERRPSISTDVFRWGLSEGPVDGLCTDSFNVGSGGTATMLIQGTNLYQMGPEGSICGRGTAYAAGKTVAGAYYVLASTTQVHASALEVSAWITPRDWSVGNGIITGCYTDSGTVLELGVTSAGLPYMTARIAGGVGAKTAAGSFALTKCRSYRLKGIVNGTQVYLLVDGQQVDPSTTTYVANNIDYTGANMKYSIFNTSTGAPPSGNTHFCGLIEEVAYSTYVSSTRATFDEIRATRRGEARTRRI